MELAHCIHVLHLTRKVIMAAVGIVQVIGTMAAIASVVSFSPQAWKIIRTRDVKGLSTGMYTLTVAAFALWMTYGLLQGDWTLFVPNFLCLIFSGFILMMIMMPKKARDNVSDTINDKITPEKTQ